MGPDLHFLRVLVVDPELLGEGEAFAELDALAPPDPLLWCVGEWNRLLRSECDLWAAAGESLRFSRSSLRLMRLPQVKTAGGETRREQDRGFAIRKRFLT